MLAAWLVTFVQVQVSQHLLRARAERLRDDVRLIQVDKTSWSDMKGLMARWDGYVSYEGDCTAVKCEFKIAVNDFGNGAPWGPGDNFVDRALWALASASLKPLIVLTLCSWG
jgi:hypothetical protein